MSFSPIISWQMDGETVETAADFIFLGSKITADGDCSHEIKRLAPWKEIYDQPRQHIKKQDTACLGLVHGDDPETCYGEGSGRGVHVWERM